MFPRGAFEVLEQSRFTVTPQSNRMGYRLGGAVVPSADAPSMISDAAFTGGLQIPPSGEPIVLMADRQTTGGYPQIGVVITADLPAVAQLAPGDWIEFAWCSMREARAARSERGLA
jgi:antagonist of KipI